MIFKTQDEVYMKIADISRFSVNILPSVTVWFPSTVVLEVFLSGGGIH